MSKQQFLDELAARLREEGAELLVAENLNFYRSYIEEEVAKGRSEEEVLAELGNPALIARSILDAAGFQVDGMPDRNPEGDLGAGASKHYREQSETPWEERDIHIKVQRFNSWLLGLLFLLFALLLILAVAGLIIWAAPVIFALLAFRFVYQALSELFRR